MSVEYAPKGLIGLLTPQANTTVEPEMAIMTPPGYAFINARLMSDKSTIEARLVDYFATLSGQLRQFANAPIGTALVATSGMSYLSGVEAEARVLAEVSAKAGIPVFTSAIASVAMLRALGARRIALVSPYPESLNVESRKYWSAHGFTITAETGAFKDVGNFHPIYSLFGGEALKALDELPADAGFEAVLMLGTGMPTLEPIRRRPFVHGAPVISCMLATAWRTTRALDKGPLTRESALAWIENPKWGPRLDDLKAVM
jgi:maleate isomerase